MANTLSARKRARASLKRRERNRMFASAAKTHVTGARAAVQRGDTARAEPVIRSAVSALDRASQKGAIHPRNAARRKSRLVLGYNRAVTSIGEEAARPTRRRRQAEPKAAEKAPAKRTTRSKKTATKSAAAKKTSTRKSTKK